VFETAPHTALAVRELARGSGLGPGSCARSRFDAHFAPWRDAACPWLLESALAHPRLGRFSFAGADPYLVLRARGRKISLTWRRAPIPGTRVGTARLEADPLECLRAFLPRVDAGAAQVPLPFAGGAVGYLGYELGLSLEGIAPSQVDDLGLPDLVMLFVDRVLAFDAEAPALYACGLGFGRSEGEARRAAEHAAAELERGPSREALAPAPAGAEPARPCSGSDPAERERHAKATEAILREIAAGEVYQACLTRRVSRACRAQPFALYQALRRENPAPFAAWLSLPELCIAGSSPERFLGLDAGGRVESRPIKGTRPRGRTPEADAAQREALRRSEKDRAENLMIVDLVRNDLGRVCLPGSISVPELFALEPYAGVFQLVSAVRGQLAPGRDAVDLIRAAFPPGSMTGAPKIAAMRLLASLESLRRGVYSGALGYLDARGGMDLCVVIRTLLLQRGVAYLHSGGGIVADSDPSAEWQESLDKLAPLLAALDALDAADAPA